MRRMVLFLLGLQLVSNQHLYAEHSKPNPKAKGKPSPVQTATPQVNPKMVSSPTPVPQKLKSDSKVLIREFTRAQSNEMRAIEHRNKFDLKELKASQEARLREWKKKEQEDRHKYFEAHPKGQERRAYVQDFIKRRDELFKQFADEKTRRIQEQDQAIKAMRKVHVEKLNQFKKQIAQGLQPSADLWPKAGR